MPRLFTWGAADAKRVRRLVAGTGSTLDDEGLALYGRLVADPAHVAGALAMMARWDLQTFAAQLPRLRTPLHLLAAEHDRAVPPANAKAVAAMLPGAPLTTLPGLGHLAHEEQPQRVADLLLPLIGLPSPVAGR